MCGKDNMKKYILLVAASALLLTACDKVSPIGVLVAGTAVEDRVKMSNLYFQQYKQEQLCGVADEGDYTFLVGADSHLTTDPSRIEEMLQNALDHNDLLVAHLGDIADTKPEYYILLEQTLREAKEKYADKNYEKMELRVNEEDDDPITYYRYKAPKGDGEYDEEYYTLDEIVYPFFPVVGNHDITHNGWAMWSNIFHSSFYEFYVEVVGTDFFDHFIFLDTASGTLGQEQVRLIEEGVLDGKMAEEMGCQIRNTFVFSHTNIFRPSSLQFSSTFAREETFFLLNQFKKWNATIVFCGHVHKWDEQEVGGVRYITLDSMSENNNPEPGDYVVRIHVGKDGSLTWERIHMNTRKQ